MLKWKKCLALALAAFLAAGLLPMGALASETTIETDETVEETIPAVVGDWVIDEQNFPDESFRAYVLSTWDLDGDGALSREEAAEAEEMDLRGLGAASLLGVELFPNLKKLDCSGNPLSSLDLTGMENLRELRCHGCGLTELALGQCPVLETLYCSKNQLTALDLTGCPRLDALLCQDNLLEELDLSQNPALEFLFCSDNCLPFLNGGEGLAELQAQGNVSFRPELTDSRSLELASIPGFDPARAGSWKNATVAGGVLTVEEYAAWVSFTYDTTGQGEGETFVWRIPKPAGVAINEKNFPDDHFRQLVTLTLDTKRDRVLTPEETAAAEEVNLEGWQVASLAGIENFTALKTLNCSDNALAFLDVSGCPALEELNAEGNTAHLETGLDRTLDVTAIPGFDPHRASDWTGGELVGNLLSIDGDKVCFTYDVDGSLGDRTAEFTWAFSFTAPRSLAVDEKTFPDECFRSCILKNIDLNGDGLLDEQEAGAVTRLCLEGLDIASLEGVERFANLTTLFCGGNPLESLDLSACTNLVTLNCDGCGLRSLTLPAGEKLAVLSCEQNRLTELNLRDCPGLKWLFCGGNRLEELDVSANKQLEKLACLGSGLEELDLSNNPQLNQLLWEGEGALLPAEPEDESAEASEAEPEDKPEEETEAPENEHEADPAQTPQTCAHTSHVFAQWSPQVLPTCHSEGILGHSLCTVCGKAFDEHGRELASLVIPAAPDRHGITESVPGTAPTCTESGFTAGVRCLDCGAYVFGHSPIPPAHRLSPWIRAVPATADTPGVKGHFSCLDCGAHFDAEGTELEDLTLPTVP